MEDLRNRTVPMTDTLHAAISIVAKEQERSFSYIARKLLEDAMIAKKEKSDNLPVVKKTKKATDKFDPSIYNCESWGWPYMPDARIYNDWLAMRKKNKYTISETSMGLIGSQLVVAQKYGHNIELCLATAETKKWKSFRAEWMNDSSSRDARHRADDNSTRGNTLESDLNDRTWAK